MEKIVLNGIPRDIVGKKLRSTVRRDGMIPAVLYGHSFEPQKLSLNAHDFTKIFDSAGHNTILDLKIEGGKDYNVLVHDVARDTVTDALIHADLYRVKMDEEIRTTVPLHFTGESTAVFQEGGSLLTNLEELEIETLPAKIPASIDVDISILDDFEKTITVADIAVPEGVKVLNDTEELVARIEEPRSDEELAALDEEVGDEVPEGVNDEEGEQDGAEASEEAKE